MSMKCLFYCSNIEGKVCKGVSPEVPDITEMGIIGFLFFLLYLYHCMQSPQLKVEDLNSLELKVLLLLSLLSKDTLHIKVRGLKIFHPCALIVNLGQNHPV